DEAGRKKRRKSPVRWLAHLHTPANRIRNAGSQPPHNLKDTMYYSDGLLHITWMDKPLAFILKYPGYCGIALARTTLLIWKLCHAAIHRRRQSHCQHCGNRL